MFTDYSQTIDDVYENLEDYNQTKTRNVLIVFDNMIADVESKKSKPYCYNCLSSPYCWIVFN